MIARKSRREIDTMRRAGRLVAEVLALVEEALKPGVTTRELDRIAERHIRAAGATPSFFGYLGNGRYGKDRHAFSGAICASIDDEVVHGIPGDRVIRSGQIVSIDVGTIVDGWHGDGARTFLVGDVPAATASLVETTSAALLAGIAAAVPGNRLGDISGAIEDVARPLGYGIVRQFVGHGIGTQMHEEPQVANYRTGARGVLLQPGLCLAIEPMLTLGDEAVRVKPDGWTVVTTDGSMAAHFEHTIAVTENGPEILTSL